MNAGGGHIIGAARHISWPAAALLSTAAAFVISKAGRDSLYFREDGLHDLPWAYVGIAILSIPLSALTLSAIRVFGGRCTGAYAPLMMACLQLALWPLLTPGGGPLMTLFFMLIPLGYGVLFSLGWLHASEFVDSLAHDQQARVYGILGATPMLGGILGAAVAKALAGHTDPQWLVVIGAACLVVSSLLVLAGQKAVRNRAPCKPCATGSRRAGRMPLRGGVQLVLRQPFVRHLLAVAMIGTAVGVLVEFQFYAAAASLADDPFELSDLFANFYLALSVMALAIQLLMTPALQRRVGIGGNLIILPSVLLSGAAVTLMTASGAVRAALRVTEGSLKSSVHRSSWEQVYLPLEYGQRRTAKVLIDAMAVHVAEGITAGFLLFGLWWFPDPLSTPTIIISWISYALVIGSAAWVVLTIILRGTLLERSIRRNEGEEEHQALLPDGCVATAILGDEIRRESATPPGRK
jgi:ATP/ADP translocase